MSRGGLALPRKFGEIITADHNVLSGESESRLEHRYDAVGVQDFNS